MSESGQNKSRKVDLKGLLVEVRACGHCPDLPLGPRPVLSLSPTARLVIAAQAPGTRVHETGVPFNDPSGDRLREWMGIGRETFYDAAKINIIPMGFCYPGRAPGGGDLPPRPACSRLWHERIFGAIRPPRLILVIGQYAQAWHLGKRRQKNLTGTVREWKSYLPSFLPLPHPSPRNNIWLRRNPWFESEVLPVLKGLVDEVLQE